MGILNATPDSFSDGGLYTSLESALDQALRMIDEGAHIIDIGGESTRPGADDVSHDEEIARTIPLIRALRAARGEARISIDTRHASVAEAALEAGADIINDVSGLRDPAMRALCAKYRCGIILMHMQGEPKSMQEKPQYRDIVSEVHDYFAQQIALAQQDGIACASICIDPGIGFGKTSTHNLELIANLEQLRPSPEIPIMMALSRKRFMGEILGSTELGRSPLATASMTLLSAERGAELHRVHDVAACAQALQLRAALTT